MKKSISLIRLHGNKIGGTESASNQLADLLFEDYNVDQYYLLNGNEGAVEKGRWINIKHKKKFILFILYFFELRQIAKRYNICISTDIATSVLLLIHKLFGLKTNIYCWEHYPFLKNSFFWRFLFKKCFLHQFAELIICISPLALLDYNFCKRICVIPNSVKQVNDRAKHEHVDLLRCLYIGRVVKDKGVDRLAEIFSVLDEDRFSLTIVGGGTELYYLSDKFKDNRNIHFEGPSNSVDKYLKSYDVFVSGSYYECFPITVLEAMSHGLPVVSMDLSGGTEAVLSASGGGFVCDDISQFKSSLKHLTDPNVRTLCGMKGAKFLEENYSAKSVRMKWLAILNGNI